MKYLEIYIALLALIGNIGFLSYLRDKWKKELDSHLAEKYKDWEELLAERLLSYNEIVKRFTSERLDKFREEIKKACPHKTSSQTPKVASLRVVKKSR